MSEKYIVVPGVSRSKIILPCAGIIPTSRSLERLSQVFAPDAAQKTLRDIC